MSKYQIFAAKPARFSEVGVIIMTTFLNPGGYPRGECFVVLPAEKEPIFAKRLSFNVKSFADSPVELDEDFMLEQALGQAKIDLATYVEKKCKSLTEIWDIADLIKPADVKFLAHLWVKGSCKRLVEIYQRTECDLLRDALRPILDLPNIIRRDLE